MLRALGSVSCDITHETGFVRCVLLHTEHCVLRRVISYTRQGICYHLLRALAFGSASRDITHETKGTMFDLLRALDSASCDSASRDIAHETRGTICHVHWVLHLVISYTRQGVRFVTGIGFYVL